VSDVAALCYKVERYIHRCVLWSRPFYSI